MLLRRPIARSLAAAAATVATLALSSCAPGDGASGGVTSTIPAATTTTTPGTTTTTIPTATTTTIPTAPTTTIPAATTTTAP